jgi:taurine dioxygenase
MQIEFKPLTPNIGTEVLNFNLSEILQKDDLQQIDTQFNHRGVLVFRNQNLTEQQHINFSKYFGNLEIHVLKQYLLPENPEILLISNIKRDGINIGVSDAGQYWHTDLSYMSHPSRCSILLSKVIPDPQGEKTFGDTCFISTTAAYEALDEETKNLLKNLKARHSYSSRYAKLQEGGKSTRPPLTEEQKKQVPEVVHPVIRTHPITGKKSIYVNEGFTTEILSLPTTDSKKLLERLYEHCQSEDFMYRHKWQVGDVLMWDNCATQHLAIPDYGVEQHRLMHRTTVQGSAVF